MSAAPHSASSVSVEYAGPGSVRSVLVAVSAVTNVGHVVGVSGDWCCGSSAGVRSLTSHGPSRATAISEDYVSSTGVSGASVTSVVMTVSMWWADRHWTDV